MSPDELKARLLAEIDNVGIPFPIVFANGSPFLVNRLRDIRPGDRAVLGEVNRFGFRLQLRRHPPRLFSSTAYGTIRSTPRGAEIRVRFRFHPGVVALLLLALAWAATVVLFLYQPEPYPSLDWWRARVLAPVVFLGLGLGVPVYARWQAHWERPLLLRFLSEQMGAPEEEILQVEHDPRTSAAGGA